MADITTINATGDDEPLRLTQRESEILKLVEQGLSNREIAERLMVSVRTIEGHLYRTNMKRGGGDS